METTANNLYQRSYNFGFNSDMEEYSVDMKPISYSYLLNKSNFDTNVSGSNDSIINPWQVENLQEFLYYHCPQCEFTSKELVEFYSHAVENHQQARIEFCKDSNVTPDIKDIDVPPEIMDHSQQINLDLSTVESQHVIEDYGKLVLFDMLDCHSCDKVVFNMPAKRVNHMLDDHSYQWKEGVKTYQNLQCPQCPELVLKATSSFLSHLVDHENEKYGRTYVTKAVSSLIEETFRCSYENCSTKRFFKFENLQEHLLYHDKAGKKELYNANGMLQCEECGWTTMKDEPKRLLKHNLYEHPENNATSDFMCEICGKYFYDSLDLEKHAENEHGNGSDIVCAKCGHICKSKMELTQHKEKNHFENKRKMKVDCKICNKKLSLSSLRDHMKLAHQDQSLRTCHLCNKVLKSRAFLYTHYINDHPTENCPVEIDNVSVFKCHFCDQIFSTSAATYTHMKQKHNVRKSHNEIKASSKPECPFCDETLKSEIDFIDHLVKNHPEKEAPYDILKSFQNGYKCLGCGDFNQSPFSYYRHIKYNHQKIRVKGGYSAAGYSYAYLYKSRRTKEFSKCQFCYKKFKELKSLEIHILKKHQKL